MYFDLEYCECCGDDEGVEGRTFAALRDMDLCDICYEEYRERDDALWERENEELIRKQGEAREAKMKWEKWTPR
ncbi:MAG: hypothetical protein AAF125_11530 [Chloroflexota bacterium]